jgi:hypothetical protein
MDIYERETIIEINVMINRKKESSEVVIGVSNFPLFQTNQIFQFFLHRETFLFHLT